MFRFANIEFLWFLVLVPVFIMGYELYRRKQRAQLERFGDRRLLEELMPNVSYIRPRVKFYLMLLVFVLLVIAVARPQNGLQEQSIKREGIEVMIALDISNSMMAEDVAPNRLERAKQVLSKLIDGMTDDKVGLVVFAGESFIQLPITADYVSAKMFLNNIEPSLIGTQGTAIGNAINTSLRAFGSEKSEASRVIVIITDGENHEDDAVEMARKAKERGVRCFVLGIGKPEGSPIPIPGTNDFRKDRAGNIVVSALNEQMCREIAQAADGIYVRCDNSNTALKTVEKELDNLAKAELETTSFAEYKEQYQSFVILALLVLLIEFLLLSRKNKSLSKINLFKENI